MFLLICSQPIYASENHQTRTRAQEKSLQVVGGFIGGGLCFVCTSFTDDPTWTAICFILEPVWRYLDGPKPEWSLVPLSSVSSWLGYWIALNAAFAAPHQRIDWWFQKLSLDLALAVHTVNAAYTFGPQIVAWRADPFTTVRRLQ